MGAPGQAVRLKPQDHLDELPEALFLQEVELTLARSQELVIL